MVSLEGKVVSVREVGFAYPGTPREILSGVTFDLRAGEVVSLLGASGSGKTTLLNLIAGLLTPTHGQIAVERMARDRPNIGYIFQADALLPWRTVEGNIRLGMELSHHQFALDEQQSRIREYLRRFGLDASVLSLFPSALSGGMRQRVAMIQAMATNPSLLLLDEPFGSLDLVTKLRLEVDVRRLIDEERRAAVIVTHDIAEAVAISDRVLILAGAPASVQDEYKIAIGQAHRDPAAARSLPEFGEYVVRIWRRLSELVGDKQ